MKFGKRLAGEAARKFGDAYFDYKSIKNAIKADVEHGDTQGSQFQQHLVAELQKVSQHYSATASQLEQQLLRLSQSCACRSGLSALRAEIKDLQKYVALNYLAVVKAIKKRNRHLKEAFGAAANTSLHALDLLIGEVFFTSPRLASLATQAEVLAREALSLAPGTARPQCTSAQCPAQRAAAAAQKAAAAAAADGTASVQDLPSSPRPLQADAAASLQLSEEFTCPICLDTLHAPVVLTCAHRFCWSCLVAHCTATRDGDLQAQHYTSQSPLPGGAAPMQAHASAAATAGRHMGDSAESLYPKGPPSPSSSYSEAKNVLTKAVLSYRVLEQIAVQQEEGPMEPQFYGCPVCRKPHHLDLDTLQVDQCLEQFIESLQATSGLRSKQQALVQVQVQEEQQVEEALAAAEEQDLGDQGLAGIEAPERPQSPEPWGIIPRQLPQYKGKLTVLLDLDGTLVASFTPKRAPRLPSSVRTHMVGMGSKLNPHGVFVVERPGLTQFLTSLSTWAEVIVYTAGLEDYAAPIIRAIDPHRKYFAHCIFREGTLRTEHYQCVKDMARLNRDLGRTVLVDDTPLAFLHQPDNGVPVLGFRGDPDDRLLMEAVLPLLESLAPEADVRPMLGRRFDMCAWFKRHGLPVDQLAEESLRFAAEEREAHRLQHLAAQQQQKAAAAAAAAGVVKEAILPHRVQVRASAATGGAVTAGGVAGASVVPVAAAHHGQGGLSRALAGCSAAAGAAAPVQAARAFSSPPCSPSSGRSSESAMPPGGVSAATAAAAAAAVGSPRPLDYPVKECLFLCDFDKTLVDGDAGERLMEALAPELLPMLVGIEGPPIPGMAGLKAPGAFVPITNTLLAECARRGVSRDALVAALQQLGASADFVPQSSVEMLRDLSAVSSVEVKLLSDANSVFISHILSGAKAGQFVTEVITNPAAFERAVPAGSAGVDGPGAGDAPALGALGVLTPSASSVSPSSSSSCASPHADSQGSLSSQYSPSCSGSGSGSSGSYKLVVQPRHARGTHSCTLCPDNMCKGKEVRALRASGRYRRLVYAGDGINDLCAALALGPHDVVLARAGYPLARALQRPPAPCYARVVLWNSHTELAQLARHAALRQSSASSPGGC